MSKSPSMLLRRIPHPNIGLYGLLYNDNQVNKMSTQSMEWSPDAYLLFFEVVQAKDLSVSDTPEKGGPTTSLNE